jgi:hypothetical protein
LLSFLKKNRLKKELISELKKACEIASYHEGGYSGDFLDATEFYQVLKIAVIAFENGDNSRVKDLWIWFAPTTTWDDFIGTEGIDLGNSIFSKIQAYMVVHNIEI